MSLPLTDFANADDDVDQGEDNGQETHIRAESNLDPGRIQRLETEFKRTMQPGTSFIDPRFNTSLPDSSVAPSATTGSVTTFYTSNSLSMESFTLDTFNTLGGATTADYERRYGKQRRCCASIKKQVQISDDNGIDSPGGAGANGLNSDNRQNGGQQKSSEPLQQLLPDPAPEDKNKICLVLDLDETLVHSSFLSIPHADFNFVLDQVGVFVCIRPGAERFLKELGNLYELVIFTASCQPYADPVIDRIDPGRMVKYRLYRDSCTDFGGNFVKDLSRLNRNLERIIIIDNSPAAYIFQPFNAIKISSWYDEPLDMELIRLLDFLKRSCRVENIYDLFTQ